MRGKAAIAAVLLAAGIGLALTAAAMQHPAPVLQADNWLINTLATGQGLYRCKEDGLVWYLDWETAAEQPLCGVEGCLHRDDSCPAWLGAQPDNVLLCAGGRLLACVSGQQDRTIWQLDPAGTGRTLLARVPLPQDSIGGIRLLWYSGDALWFAGDLHADGESWVVLWRWDIRAQSWQMLDILPRPVQQFYHVRDGIFYFDVWNADSGTADLYRCDLEAGQVTWLLEYDPDWQRILLQGQTLYLSERREGCAIYTKNLLDDQPPALRCRLPQFTRDSFAYLLDAWDDRVVLQWKQDCWAVNLDSGAVSPIQPVAMVPKMGPDDPEQTVMAPIYPEYGSSNAAGGWALCVGYQRRRNTLSVDRAGGVQAAEQVKAVWCRLDRDAYLDGIIRLTEIHTG